MLTLKVERSGGADLCFYESPDIHILQPGSELWQETWGRGAEDRRAAVFFSAGMTEDETEIVFIEKDDNAYLMNSNGKTVQII